MPGGWGWATAKIGLFAIGQVFPQIRTIEDAVTLVVCLTMGDIPGAVAAGVKGTLKLTGIPGTEYIVDAARNGPKIAVLTFHLATGDISGATKEALKVGTEIVGKRIAGS